MYTNVRCHKTKCTNIVDNLLSLQLRNIYQLIARMIRESQFTGYASSIPVLLQNKKTTGSLAAPKAHHPYQKVLLSSDGTLSRDDDLSSGAGISTRYKLWEIKLLRCSCIVSGNGKVLLSDGVLISDGISILSNSWLFGFWRHFGIFSSNEMLSSDKVFYLIMSTI